MREFWKSDLEKWFDPSFQEVVNKELTLTISK